MHVVVTGGTGFIGSRLVELLVGRGCEVSVLTRSPKRAQSGLPPGARALAWTPKAAGDWQSVIDGAGAVIHLAGKPVLDERWTDAVKAEVRDSRVLTTGLIAEAIQRANHKPSVWLSGSAVGYYGDRPEPVSEDASPGDDYLARVCQAWEEATGPALEHTRVVKLRIGMAIGQGGGSFPMILKSTRLFAGGYPGDGSQAFPWIHLDDVCGAILFAMDHDELQGPINVTAPEPPTLKEFTTVLGQLLNRPVWLPVPKFAVKLAMGERSLALLSGQNASPTALIEAGFQWRFPRLKEALQALVAP